MKRPVNASIEEMNRYADLLEQRLAAATTRMHWLEEQLRLARHQRFGPSSERTHPDQMAMLFDEAEVSAKPEAPEPTLENVTSYRRRKKVGHREEMLGDLPVERIEYRLPEEEQVCTHCDGRLHEMSTEVRRELKIIPAHAKVIEHVQFVYSCRCCERGGLETPIECARAPKPVIPKSLASPSVLSHVMTQKYVLGVPLYRQEQEFERQALALSRQTLANWVLIGAERWLTHLYDRMRAHLLVKDILHADETTVQVLHEPGRKAQTKSHMWLYRTGRDGPPIVVFEYHQSRSGEHPRTFLSGYSGYLHVDGYAGYESVPNVTLVGCWSHARRKFDEALKSLPSSARSSGPVAAQMGLDYCNRLFKIEQRIKKLPPDRCKAEREANSLPVLEDFKQWLTEQSALPKSGLGTAITYCQNQWTKLTAFLEDGRLEIDNNRAERTVKPFVIGRKNWLFSDGPRGAQASAVIYSVVETAKENGLKPAAYLTHLFETLPNIDSKRQTAPTECHGCRCETQVLSNPCRD